MNDTPYTAEEVRTLLRQMVGTGAHALHIPDAPSIAGMLKAFADRLEEDENAKPVAPVAWRWWVMGVPLKWETSPLTPEDVLKIKRQTTDHNVLRFEAAYSEDSNRPAPASSERLAEALCEYCDRMESFQPQGELGAMHGVGMAFAYKDAANIIRGLIAAHATAKPAAASVPDGWMRNESKVRELLTELQSRGWQPDSQGDPDCADQASAMAAEVIERVLLPILAAQQESKAATAGDNTQVNRTNPQG